MKKSDIFLSPRLVGRRFEGHAIPLEILKEFAALEEMVIEVAKWLYLQKHPDRARTPRGFTEGISLVLTAVTDGSAIPEICLVSESNEFLPSEKQLYYQQARENIINAIDAAEHDLSAIQFLPENLLGYFDRIGRALREDEEILFNPTNATNPARLNKQTRRKLLVSSQIEELTEEVILRGSIPEADQGKMSFALLMLDGSRVVAPIEPQHFSTVMNAFNSFKDGRHVIIKGIGRYNRNYALKEIDSIEHLSVLDPNDIALRLEELAELKDGWLNGEGIAPDKVGISWLTSSFEKKFPDDLQLPYLYPTEDGGIQAEWSLSHYEISLTINLIAHTAVWQVLNITNDSDETKDLSLDNDEDWKWLVGQLSNYLSAVV